MSGHSQKKSSGASEFAGTGMSADYVPPSYGFGAMKASVPALINILRIDGNFKPISDINRGFASRIDLERSPPYYRFFLFPSLAKNLRKDERIIDLSRLLVVKPSKKEKQTLIFSFKTFELTLQFRLSQKCEYYYTVVTKILKIMEVTRSKGVPKKIPRYEYHPITDYEVKSEGKKGVIKPLRTLSGPISRVDSSANLKFYQKNSESWGPNDFFNFLKHVLIQGEGENEIDTVYDYIKEQGYFESMNDYFYNSEEHTVYTLFMRIRNLDPNEDLQKLHPFQQYVAKDTNLLEILKNEFVKLRSNRPDHLFDIHFFLVLLKRVEMLEEYIEVGQIRLKDIQHELIHYTSFRYSVVECRNHILSFLLHEKGFETYVDDLFSEFQEVEKEIFGEVDKPSEYDPVKWEKMLKEFNVENKIKMESVSYEVNIEKKNNDIRHKKVKCMREEIQTKRKIQEFDTQIEKMKEEAEKVLEQLMELMEGDDEGSEYEKFEERSTQLDQEQVKLSMQKKKFQTKLEKLLAEQRKFKLWNHEINVDSREKMKSNYQKCMFNARAIRKRELEKTLLQQALQGRAGKGVQELGVKLVMSVLTDHEPDKWQMEVVRKLDKFTKFSFYKWGFLHANIQIMNLGLHWFGDSLVKITNHAIGRNYEEIAAFDCFCPLMLNPTTIFDTITLLAEEIVSVNVNIKYSYHNVWGKAGTLNCQEFCQLMLSKLGAPSARYPEVSEYMETLKDALSRMGTQTAKNLRFIKFNKKKKKDMEFMNKFKDAFTKDEKFKPDKKGKIYFNSHEDLDKFYDQLTIVDHKFETNYPGYFELLKGFDRAFWMRALKDMGGDEAKSTKESCPFCYNNDEETEDVE